MRRCAVFSQHSILPNLSAQEFKKRALNQNRAFANLFRSPNRIEDIGDTITRLERGDLKLRVRALGGCKASSVDTWTAAMGCCIQATLD